MDEKSNNTLQGSRDAMEQLRAALVEVLVEVLVAHRHGFLPLAHTIDRELLDWLADNRIIEGLACLEDDLHIHACREVKGVSQEEEKRAYRLGLRKMLIDAMKKTQGELDEDIR